MVSEAGQREHDGLILAGVITTLVLPFIGFIIGIILLAKGRTKEGLFCSIVSFLIMYVALCADGQRSTSPLMPR